MRSGGAVRRMRAGRTANRPRPPTGPPPGSRPGLIGQEIREQDSSPGGSDEGRSWVGSMTCDRLLSSPRRASRKNAAWECSPTSSGPASLARGPSGQATLMNPARQARNMPVAKPVAADATTTAREKELGCRPSPDAVRARSAALRLLLRRRFLPITWQHLLYSPLAPGREGSATGSMSAAGTNESLLGMMTSARLPSFSTALRSTIPFRNSTYATTEYT